MSTNKLDWQVKYSPTDGLCYSGVLSTAGGLVFTAPQGNNSASISSLQAQGVAYGGHIYAYDAKTGKQLWSWQAPDYIYAPPVTYMVKGKQYLSWYVTGPTTSQQVDRFTVFSL